MGLSSEQLASFEEDGYLHIKGALSPETCDKLREKAAHYVAQCDPKEHTSVFTTDDQTRKMNDEYFLSSGDNISYFFEEHAFDEKNVLQVPLNQAINKIGHNLHNLDPDFKDVSYSDSVKDIVKSLGYRKPMAVQSMYIFKQPRIGGKVSPHQDGTFLYTRPQSVVGLWWALEDCTPENGCLYGVPGSHKGPVKQHFRRTTEEEQKESGQLLLKEPENVELDIEGSKPILTKKGDLVLLHSSLVHYSNANTSDHSRHAYSIHVVESDQVEYPRENWLQTSDGSDFKQLYDE